MWTGRTVFTILQARGDYAEVIVDRTVLFMRQLKLRRSLRRFLGACVIVVTFAGCADASADLCSQAVSVPSFASRFVQGLDNFGEDQYENLRRDTERSRETVVGVLELFPDDAEVAAVLQKIDTFILAMEDANWDVSVALLDVEANSAANALGDVSTIIQANQVDVYVISRCGLPSTFVPNDITGETLPSPWIPGPTDTEPETNLVDEQSELFALGQVIGTLFQLTLDQDEVLCLGTELVGVVDRSDLTSNTAQYKQQFQSAFDACSIKFTVPLD